MAYKTFAWLQLAAWVFVVIYLVWLLFVQGRILLNEMWPVAVALAIGLGSIYAYVTTEDPPSCSVPGHPPIKPADKS